MNGTIKKWADDNDISIDCNLDDNGNYSYDLQFYSEAGQDVNYTIELGAKDDASKFLNELEAIYENYDADEEAYKRLGPDGHGKNGAPHSMRAVLEDMEDVEERLGGLCRDLSERINSIEDLQLYRIVALVQDGEMLTECDKLYEGEGYDTIYTDQNGEAVIDYLKEYDLDSYNISDLQEENPHICYNGTDYTDEKDGYTLRYNSTIGGVYMLFREANEQEIQYYIDEVING